MHVEGLLRSKATFKWLLATLIAAVIALYVRVLCAPYAKRRSLPSKKTGDDASLSARRTGCAKGVAPQKIDLFTEAVRKEFASETEESARLCFPRKFEVHGHVVVTRMNPGVTVERFHPFAEAFARSFSPVDVDVVLLDSTGILGELRKPHLSVLYSKSKNEIAYLKEAPRTIAKRWREQHSKGLTSCVSEGELLELLKQYASPSTFTLHIENGVRYSFDVHKVMFCSGNTTERTHFAEVNASGETVVDMFAGIGYFTVPLAIHGGVAALHALEKNPDSVAFLKLNAVQNRVGHLIHPYCGDNREVGEELGGKCDRVLMGYIPSCKEFLPRALFFLRKVDGRPLGVIHYHLLADKAAAQQTALQDAREELGEDAIKGMKITGLRRVKSYAPKRFHFVADLTFD